MLYSTFFNKIKYDAKEIVNIFKKFDIIDTYKNSITYYTKYYVQDGEMPEHIAEKFYGNKELYFVIMLMNDIFDVYYGFPKSSIELDSYIEKLVEDTTNELNTTLIEDAYQEFQTLDWTNMTDEEKRVVKQKYVDKLKFEEFDWLMIKDLDMMCENFVNNMFDNWLNGLWERDDFLEYLKTELLKEYIGSYEKEKNEEKREIKILRPAYLEQLLNEMEFYLNE